MLITLLLFQSSNFETLSMQNRATTINGRQLNNIVHSRFLQIYEILEFIFVLFEYCLGIT
jgi:hypothetical protein